MFVLVPLAELHGLAEPTPAADWWSLGAILFELLTGKVQKYVHCVKLRVYFQLFSRIKFLLHNSHGIKCEPPVLLCINHPAK